MEIILAALAVYKAGQIIDALLPRAPMPWVKVLAIWVLSLGVVVVWLSATGWDIVILSLAVATLAGVVHTSLRLLTYLGDMALRKSVK